jgi:dipeptidyl aminopeptidase/acylaminoacyl peptidase
LGEKQLIKISNDRTPGKIYLFEKQRKKLSLLADLNPRISEKDMAAMQYVHYQAQDGLRIPAYLTLPPHKPAIGLPTIVLPHGGPEWRDDAEYNAHVQYLAHKGYAILQPNFRGSMSYGKAFRTAGFREWGGKMQDDLRDGVQWLVDKKIADPKRLVIYGGSYGGYAALMGIVKTPNLYAAAVDVVGISNISTFLNSIPAYWSHYHEPYRVEIGDVDKEPEFIQSISPLYQVKRVQVPVFIAQGGNDPRVVRKESDQMVDALQKQGVEVEYMFLPDEGHGFSKAAHVIAFYKKMNGFLEKYIETK